MMDLDGLHPPCPECLERNTRIISTGKSHWENYTLQCPACSEELKFSLSHRSIENARLEGKTQMDVVWEEVKSEYEEKYADREEDDHSSFVDSVSPLFKKESEEIDESHPNCISGTRPSHENISESEETGDVPNDWDLCDQCSRVREPENIVEGDNGEQFCSMDCLWEEYS